MNYAVLLHELPLRSAMRRGEALALVHGAEQVSYADLANSIDAFANALLALGLQRGERVAIFLDKRSETVIACFGTSAAGGVFVPINPLLKGEQVGHILRDCNARILVTAPERLALLDPALSDCNDLRHVVVVGEAEVGARVAAVETHRWDAVMRAPSRARYRVIDRDMLAILYTSGSTGRPKGVVLSHQNMVAGAKECRVVP